MANVPKSLLMVSRLLAKVLEANVAKKRAIWFGFGAFRVSFSRGECVQVLLDVRRALAAVSEANVATKRAILVRVWGI